MYLLLVFPMSQLNIMTDLIKKLFEISTKMFWKRIKKIFKKKSIF